MAIETSTNLDYLIIYLRLHLGDIDSSSYRFLDSWLRTSLVFSVKALQRWWNHRYLVSTDYNVSRNSNHTFLFPEPPIIQNSDEKSIVLMASIIIKGGSLESNSWNVGSWKDHEISYSNIEGNRAKTKSLMSDWEELTTMMTPPNKRLAQAKKGSLPGFLQNPFEINME
jgi:hypothetical protein